MPNPDEVSNNSASSLRSSEPEFVLSSSTGSELSHHINEFLSPLVSVRGKTCNRWRVIFYPLQTALNLQLPLSPLVQLTKSLVKDSPYKLVNSAENFSNFSF